MNLTARLRARRQESRKRRILRDAIDRAPTPAMRNELIAMAHRQLANPR